MRFGSSSTMTLTLVAALAGCAASAPTGPSTGGTGSSSGSTSGGTPDGTTSGGTTTGDAPSPGVVSGIARDTRGRPLADVLVWVQPALTTGLLTAHTAADGSYRVSGVSRLPYAARAWTEVAYRGRSYCLRLAMLAASDYDAFTPTAGAVRDFRWQLQGRIPDVDDQYFGGEVRLMGDGTAPATDSIEVRMTPNGPLIDGSTGAVITRTVASNGTVQDVPAGAYTVAATLIKRGGARVLLGIGKSYGPGAATMPLEFEPTSSPSCSSGSGLKRAFVFWTVPGAG